MFMGKKKHVDLRSKIIDAVKDLIDIKQIDGLQVDENGHVIIPIDVDPAEGAQMEPLRQDIERAALAVKGVKKVTAILTAKRNAQDAGAGQGGANAVQEKSQPQRKVPSDPHGMNKNPPVDVPARHIIVVASGKGGVGKSTVAANLAVSLANAHGKKVGLLDADIYGPSQPVMMGDASYKPTLNQDKKLIPLEKHGIKIMSIGFIADTDKALVWRGPMVQTAFYQMLRDVDWATKDDPLDYLVIDLPPGTGDVQLTLAQKVMVDGAVIVSTPQDIALIDARRAVEMFGKTGVRVLGVVENMSVHVCSACGHEDHVFGHGGAKEEAEKIGVPFLGELPLSRTVREQSDAGIPVSLNNSDEKASLKFKDISAKVIDALT